MAGVSASAGERLYLGVDGGGTKTEAWIVDSTGQVRGRGTGGPSNHQESGLEAVLTSILTAIDAAARAAGRAPAQLNGAALGLAGADFPEDVDTLRQALSPRLNPVPYVVVNDGEIALRAGCRSGAGVAVVAGTGTNVVGRFRDGETFQIGGLGYELGDEGGGSDLVRHALHLAFRGAEGRGAPTLLSELALAALGMDDFPQLSRALYFGRITRQDVHVLAPLVFIAAREGDVVAQDLLCTSGIKLGETAGAAVRRIEERDGVGVEVVKVGSLWLGNHPLFADGFMMGLHRRALEVDLHEPELAPPAGAVLIAAAADGGEGQAAAVREGLLRDQDTHTDGR